MSQWITSDTSVVNQGINAAKGVPGFLHGLVDGGGIGGDIELDGHCATVSGGGGPEAVDFVAEGSEAIEAASCCDDVGASFSEVDAEVSSNSGGSTSDKNDFVF